MKTVSILLAPSAADASNKPVWVQVAAEGHFKGYHSGAFSFTRALFEQIIQNFRASPAYRADRSGKVVAWDFHHASEMNPTSGNVATNGAPAQGWVLELDVRTGADGKAQLWALTRWLEPARSYIKSGAYQWASVAVVFDAVDPVSGRKIGAVLTSIALTNKPFIEGMTPLAASHDTSFISEFRARGLAALAEAEKMSNPTERAAWCADIRRAFKLDQREEQESIRRGVELDGSEDAIGIVVGVLTEVGLKGEPDALQELARRIVSALSGGEAPPAPAASAQRVHFTYADPLRQKQMVSTANLSRHLQAKKSPPPLPAGKTIDARFVEGGNRVERALAAMRSDPNFARLPFEEQHVQASMAVREGRVAL
jgi:hypothetical protein